MSVFVQVYSRPTANGVAAPLDYMISMGTTFRISELMSSNTTQVLQQVNLTNLTTYGQLFFKALG
jgi:hypothetical protein